MTGNKKYIYGFDEGNASMRNLLGGKGANLSEMKSLGLPVPPGFVITTETCLEYYEIGNKLPTGLWDDVKSYMHALESDVGRGFGDDRNPLLVSVRSGARFSMPGMMDTILNLGINDNVVEGLATLMDDRRPAFDAYRRFIQIFGNVALGVPSAIFEDLLQERKERAGVRLDHELAEEHLLDLITDYKEAIVHNTGNEIPDDPWDQLRGAVLAVFESWNNSSPIGVSGCNPHVSWSNGEIRPIPPTRVAPRRYGGSNAGVCSNSRSDYGHGRCIYGRSMQCNFCFSPYYHVDGRFCWCWYSHICRYDRDDTI